MRKLLTAIVLGVAAHGARKFARYRRHNRPLRNAAARSRHTRPFPTGPKSPHCWSADMTADEAKKFSQLPAITDEEISNFAQVLNGLPNSPDESKDVG